MTGRLPAPILVRRGGQLTDELAREAGGPPGLGQVPSRLAPSSIAPVVCGYCAVGCSLDVHVRNGRAVSLSPSPAYPVNRGHACPKGWEALAPLAAPDRGTVPLLRRGGQLEPASWPEAVGEMVSRFRAIGERHGPAAVAFLSTGQIATEEMALLGTLAKLGMGMVHGDGNTRQCMASAVVAYQGCFGFDAPPYTYADLECSDVIVLVGSNMCIAHPILWERVCANPHHPEVIVVDPRLTETAAAGTRHLAIWPKSDLWLLYGLAHALIARGAVDAEFVAAHTSGFEGFAAHVARFTPEVVSARTGLAASAILEVANQIAAGRRVSFWWTMGVNQSHEGVRVAQAIIALALMTGNIGRLGTGANSITGQCNAMGSRQFSLTTGLFGGRRFEDAAERAEVAEMLGLDEGLIPRSKGLAYDQILGSIRRGEVRGLWVVGTNTAHSWPDRGALSSTLAELECLVVQDMYPTTETASRADVYLPAAGWGEKEGTFINSERRVGLLQRVAPAPGQALADFHIFRLVAEAWGVGPMFRDWTSPEAAFEVLQRVSRGTPCDISGIAGYEQLRSSGGVQWPYPEGTADAPAERRLFEDGRFYHPDGRARFVWDEPHAGPEDLSAQWPLRLLSGRGSSAQWHTQTRTSKCAVLAGLAPAEAYVQISPTDGEAFGIAEGDLVEVSTRRGTMTARASVTAAVGPGQIFLPMHYVGTNRLTLEVVDPHSRQPSFKDGAATLRRIGGAEASG